MEGGATDQEKAQGESRCVHEGVPSDYLVRCLGVMCVV